MKKNYLKISLLIVLMVSLMTPAEAQNWWRTLGGSRLERGTTGVPLKNGDFLIGFNGPVQNGNEQAHLTRLGPNGHVRWTVTPAGPTSITRVLDLAETQNGDFLIAGSKEIPGNPQLAWLAKTDAYGRLKWERTFGTLAANELSSVIFTLDGGCFATGKMSELDTLNYWHLLAVKTDSLGATEWQRAIGDTLKDDWGYEAVQQTDSSFSIAGFTASYGSFARSAWFLRLLPDGSLTDSARVDIGGNQRFYALTSTLDGGWACAGMSETATNGNDVLLAKFDGLGTEQWRKFIGGPGQQTAFGLKQLSDSSLVMAGTWQLSGNRDGYLLQTNSSGDSVFSRKTGGNLADTLQSLEICPDTSLLLVGTTHSFGAGSSDAWVLKTDLWGQQDGHLEGIVFHDSLPNGIPDSLEPRLANWIIKILPGPLYTLTDSVGFYQISLPQGSWQVQAISPNALRTANQPGPSGAIINIGTNSLNQTQNFGFRDSILCPELFVDAGTTFLRRCDTSRYHIQYCNFGTLSTTSSNISIELDDDLTYLTSSISPQSQSGNQLDFSVGPLNPGQCGNFTMDVFVNCQALPGLTHCLQAKIHPDTNCQIDPLWDGSSLEVEGICLNDSVNFTVRNVGANAMTTGSPITVLEDQVLSISGSVQLGAGQDTVIKIPGNGSTWTLKVDQVPFHPGNSNPISSVEACGRDSLGQFSTGLVNIFGQNDADANISIECQPNRGSFDPNDKQGIPLGVGPDYEILEDQRLEYTIRFQNTGTDTAFWVRVMDTLPSGLDLQSIRWGAVSHPHQVRILGSGILEWTFSPIELPDSNTNPGESMGFVKFQIAPVPGQIPGSQIRNRAGIYFDYNAPVITNRTLHTLADTLVFLVNLEEDGGPAHEEFRVFPNPFSERIFVEWTRPGRMVKVELWDLTGRQVRNASSSGGTSLSLWRKDLSEGLYLLVIREDGKRVACQRVLVR